MSQPTSIRRPKLAPFARYRWDEVRSEHQLVFPEGVLVLNASGAEILKHCDGRTLAEVVAAVEAAYGAGKQKDVEEFLTRLAQKGLIRDTPGEPDS